VSSHELAVEQRVAASLHPRDQPGQRNLGSIRPSAEHALAEEGASELHPVEAPRELAFVPNFDRVSVTRRMQGQHRPLDIGVDPGLFAIRAGCDHRRKITVHRNGKVSGAERPAERPRQVEFVERNDRTGPRLDPEQLGRLAAVRHGEDAGGISLQQQTRVEATHRVGIWAGFSGLSGVGELQDLAYDVLRTAQANALVGLDQRTIDQHRMLHHRVEDFVLADVRTIEPKLLGKRLF